MTKEIIGYKGGKGGGSSASAPVESPDSLRSRQYARIIDLICEGEIEGLATGDAQSIYYNQTPLMNSDGSYNFSGVTVVTREGTQGQTYIEGFPSVESETAVNVQVTQSTPVVRTITDETVDKARITISIPQLYYTNTANGNTSGTSVEFKIEVQPDGGSYVEVASQVITGKTTTTYQRSILVPLDGDAPWNVRVTRITADSTSSYLQNDIYWASYTEITDAKLSYPNSALVATVIDSQQFDSIPVRGYDMKLLRIKIPSNYDPVARTYTGSWDGTFTIAWSDNPAWVFYDMITNDRYGLGAFIDETQVDKWSLYQIAQYCDGTVPDGFGGFEPRFTCNLYIQEQREAFQVLQDLASVFRGMIYMGGGLVVPTQDSPSDPVGLFSAANVVDGRFSYSGSSLKTRHTVALVYWNDPDDFYISKPEYVEDTDGIERYGIISTSITAFGCTSRGQAHRIGKWLLYSEANETETVSFKAGLDALLVRPGQLIQVQDKNRAGVRRSGRVVSATTTSVEIDRAFTIIVGQTYTMSVMMPDLTVATALISTVIGNTVTLQSALPDTPQVNAIWAISSDSLNLQTFRVITIINGQDGTVEITGLSYNESKYDFVENDVILTDNPISVINEPPDPPQNVTVTEALYQEASVVKTTVTISWSHVERAANYVLNYRIDDGNNIQITGLTTPVYEILDAIPGIYTVSITAISVNGKRSQPGGVTQEVYGKTAPPGNVGNFSMVGVSNGVAQLAWDQSVDLDVLIGGFVRIRHSPDTVSASWANAVDIGPALPGTATTASVPHIDGTYLAKFVDSSDNTSETANSVITKTASLITMNVVDTIDESTFTGTLTDCVFPGPLGGLSLDYAMDGSVLPEGTYDFAADYDLGAVYISRLTASITVEGFDDLDDIDSRLDPIDSWDFFDGDQVDDVNATLYVRTTNDDPGGTPTWSSWRPFFVGQYEARAFQFQLKVTSGNTTHNISVTGLTVTIDMPDRVESEDNISSGTSAYAVTFPHAFWATPSIGITADNMGTGDYYTITSKSESGFTVEFKNSAGTTVSRTFDYMAKGYGYQV
jgi:predicted phage tail protein